MPASNLSSEFLFAAKGLVIIDQQPLYRKGIKGIIAQHENLKLAGEASSVKKGIELVKAEQPDLVLLTSNMKDIGLAETIKTIKQIDDRVLIIVLTDVAYTSEELYRALQAGADGCLPREIEPEELVVHLSRAVPGSIITCPSMRGSLQEILTGKAKRSGDANKVQLTSREEEILKLLATGLCNKRIGRELGISDGTVKVHIKHLLKKLQARNRLEAACWMKRQVDI